MDKENDKSDSPKKESFPTASLPDLSAVLGDQIGPYTLLSILGEGGFGIVYLAEQKHPIKRQVALKIIKPGMDSKQIIARFDAERQALALLDHPNIAHIFEAGSVEPGKPYFVMEYIKGLPITEYCDHHQLKIEERLKLFIQVCDAVGYAHQKGIIHRDIKPSNIIVTVQEGKAVPKVIDFGVAKAISMPLTEKNIFTQQGQLLGTPEYMSPEQADLKEKDIDIRTDIYSLGVVLYELLAGSLPFEPKTLREAGYSAIQRIIREQNPPRPSAKLSSLGENAKKVAQNRLTEVSTLVKSLQKELEWIPLMAIRKERQLRYQTAAELAQDIQNYMEGQPLKAGPESVRYRFRKFIRRHKQSTAVVAAITVLTIAGLIIITMLYLQAEESKIKALNAKDIAERSEKEALSAKTEAEKQRLIAEESKTAAENANEEETKQRKQAQRKSEELSLQLYARLIQSAQVELEHTELQRAYDLLQKCPESQRGWEWYFLLGQLDDSTNTIIRDADYSQSDLSSLCTNGTFLASYQSSVIPYQLHFWNLSTKEPCYGRITSVSSAGSGFYAGNNLFSYVCKDPRQGRDITLPIIDIETQEPIIGIPVDNPLWLRYLATAISPDNTLLATSATPQDTFQTRSTNINIVQLWEINTGQMIQQFTLDCTHLMMPKIKMEFSPDGTMLGIMRQGSFVSKFDELQIIDIKKGTAVWKNTIPSGEAESHAMRIFAFSPDSKSVAVSGIGSSQVDLIDLKDGAKIKEFRGHSGVVTSVAFSPDGQTLATGSTDKTIRLWDTNTAKEQKLLIGHTGSVTALTFNKNSAELISEGSDRKIKFWNWKPVPAARPNKDLHDDILIPNYQDAKNNRSISVEEQNGRINIWNTKTHTNDESLSFNIIKPKLLSYSPDGKYLAAANDREIALFNTSTKQTTLIDVKETSGLSTQNTITDIQLSAASLLVKYGNEIKLWDFDGNLTGTHESLYGQAILAHAISNDGSKLAFRKSNVFEIWDVKSNSVILTIKDDAFFMGGFMLLFDRNAEKLISLADKPEEVHIYDLATGNMITIKDEDLHCNYALNGLTDDNNLITINHFLLSKENIIQVWDIQTGQLIRSVNSINYPRTPFSFKYEGVEHGDHYVAKRMNSGKIQIIDLNTKKDICIIDGDFPAKLSPDGRHIAVTDHNKVLIHTIAQDAIQYSIDNVNKISFCSLFNNGDLIAAVTDENTLTVWQAASGTKFYSIKHDNAINHLAIDPNHQYLAVILRNGTVVVRDHDTLDPVSSFQTNQEDITTLSFSPDSNRIITGGSDETVKIWDTRFGTELLTVSRNFNTKQITEPNGRSFTPENAKLCFTPDGCSIIHRSGNRMDLNQIHEMSFKSRSLQPIALREEYSIEMAFHTAFHLSQSYALAQIKHEMHSLPNGANMKLSSGQTLLSFSVDHKYFDVAKYLLEEGAVFPGTDIFYNLCSADAKQQDPSSETLSKQKEFIDYLLGKGLQINQKTPLGYTPLHIAVVQNQLEIASYLIEKGADVNIQDSRKRTPLTLYLMQSTGPSIKLDFINLLIKNGADVNLQSNQGYPPLYYATIKGFSDVVKILLESGARPITANPKGN